MPDPVTWKRQEVSSVETVLDKEVISWLLETGEPWTRYRTLVDLLARPEDAPEVKKARALMMAHPQVQALISAAAAWPGGAFKRHNDASHTIYKLSTLADFGVRAGDPGIGPALDAVLTHQSSEGAFQSLVKVSKIFGGTGEDTWTWLACDAPTLLYVLLAMGLADDSRVKRAVDHLVGLVDANGWRCVVAPELAKFKGPGRRTDACPIANVYALKSLSQVPNLRDSDAAHIGAEMLLGHWESRGKFRLFMFGIGTDFRKLKYPLVWYDVLHVADVLSRFPFVQSDVRFRQMIKAITVQADGHGRYTATSMYRSWKDWDFANKKSPSPWLTFLVERIRSRVGNEKENP
jgi:hypothetical protein